MSILIHIRVNSKKFNSKNRNIEGDIKMLDLKSDIIPKVREETISDKLSWAQIYESLLGQFPGLKTKNTQFQFCAAPYEADWNQNETYPFNWVDGASYPGPYYSTNHGSIENDYYSFIINLEPYEPTRDPTYVKLAQNQQIYLKKYNDIIKDAQNSFEDWKANNPSHLKDYPDIITYNDWIASSFGAGYSSQITSIKAQLDDYNARLAKYSSRETVRDTLITNYKNEQNSVTVAKRLYHLMDIEPSLNDKLQQWQSGIYSNSIKIDTSSATKDENVWTVYGEGDVSFKEFIDIKADGSAFLKEDIRNDKKFSLVIEIKDVELFRFNRRGWFNESALDSLRNGPFIDKTFTTDSYFGETGSLSMIPANALVGFGITASLTLSNKTYNTYEKYWETNLEVKIGPFKINVGVNDSRITTNSTDDTTTITFNSESDIKNMNPQVIGVLCNVHMNGIIEEELQMEPAVQGNGLLQAYYVPNDGHEPHIHVHDDGVTFTNARHHHKTLANNQGPRCSAIREVLSELGNDPRSKKMRDWLNENYINKKLC